MLLLCVTHVNSHSTRHGLAECSGGWGWGTAGGALPRVIWSDAGGDHVIYPSELGRQSDDTQRGGGGEGGNFH